MTGTRPFNPIRLQEELARARHAGNKRALAKVAQRYGRKRPNGRLVRCTPGNDQPQSSLNKVIYDSRDGALAAEREFRALGAERQETYVCDRSRTGHYHLRRAR